MTCVIGLVHDSKVYMGGDRAGVDGWRRFVSLEPKVFRVGDLLVGVSGSRRVNELLKYKVAAPKQETNADMAYLVTVFAENVRKVFTESGITKKGDDGEEKFEGGLLIGYHGKLYTLYNNFQIGHYARDFDAIGSGAPFALGAMEALPGMEPLQRLRTALQAASQLCIDVSEPFDMEVL